MLMRKRNRSTGIIDRLDPDIKDAVDQMLLSRKVSYEGIVEYLAQYDVKLSTTSVFRYVQKLDASMERIRVANENFRMIKEQIEMYPDVDTSEPLLRIASQSVLNALTKLPDESWDDVSPDKLIKQITSLVRATAYKQKVDNDLRTDNEKAVAANQSLLFDVFGKKYPELYQEMQEKLRVEAEKEAQS